MINEIEILKAYTLVKQLKMPKRKSIIDLLMDKGEMSVNEITDTFGWEQAPTSIELGHLRRAEIVNVRIDYQRRFYSINQPVLDRIINAAKQMVG